MTSADEIRTAWEMIFALAQVGKADAAKAGALSISERLSEPRETLADVYQRMQSPPPTYRVRQVKLDRYLRNF